MDPSKKTLHLILEPNPEKYSAGKYSPEEIEKRGATYFDLSMRLVADLGLEGRVRELLLIGPTSTHLPESEIIKTPYYVSWTVIEGDNNYEQSIGTFCEKGGLLACIESYMRRNMDNVAFAVIQPALIDYVEIILRKRYNTELIRENNIPV